MIVSHRHRFIFLKTSKTAGSSIEIALSQYCGPDDILTDLLPEEDALRRSLGYPAGQHQTFPLLRRGCRQWLRALRSRRQIRPHIQAQEVRRLVGDRVWKSYTKFCVVRNPWDRVISQWCWTYHRIPAPNRPSLSQFLTTKRLRSMHRQGVEVYSIQRSIVADHVLRYESLTEDLSSIAVHLGLGMGLTLPRAKSGYRENNRPTMAWYDEDSSAIIAKAFAQEIAWFGYQSPEFHNG